MGLFDAVSYTLQHIEHMSTETHCFSGTYAFDFVHSFVRWLASCTQLWLVRPATFLHIHGFQDSTTRQIKFSSLRAEAEVQVEVRLPGKGPLGSAVCSTPEMGGQGDGGVQGGSNGGCGSYFGASMGGNAPFGAGGTGVFGSGQAPLGFPYGGQSAPSWSGGVVSLPELLVPLAVMAEEEEGARRTPRSRAGAIGEAVGTREAGGLDSSPTPRSIRTAPRIQPRKAQQAEERDRASLTRARCRAPASRGRQTACSSFRSRAEDGRTNMPFSGQREWDKRGCILQFWYDWVSRKRRDARGVHPGELSRSSELSADNSEHPIMDHPKATGMAHLVRIVQLLDYLKLEHGGIAEMGSYEHFCLRIFLPVSFLGTPVVTFPLHPLDQLPLHSF